MNLSFPSTHLLWMSVLVVGAGCSRSMNGSLATGPFAPAGTATQAGAPPLIPLGPVNGATRVPPPPTGSTQPANSYTGAPTASLSPAPMSQAPGAMLAQSPGLSPSPPDAFTAPAPSASFMPTPTAFRDGSGGMNVIDLTHQLPAPSVMPPQAPNNQLTAAQPFGSGVAYPSTAPVAMTGGTLAPGGYAVSSSNGQLRPIDVPANAIPLPPYRGYEPSMVTGSGVAQSTTAPVVQPVSGVRQDAWQTVRSSGSESSLPATSTNRAGASYPETSNAAANAPQVASPALPWRSPTTAR